MNGRSSDTVHEALGARLADAAPVMPADVRARVRATIMVGVRPDRVPLLVRHRVAVALAGACVAVTTMSGVTLAAAASLPGDPLHGLKLAWEQSRVVLAPTPGLRTAALRAIASDREAEAVSLRERGDMTLAVDARSARDVALSALPHLDPALMPRVGGTAGVSARLLAHAHAAVRILTAPGKGAVNGRGVARGGSAASANSKGAQSSGGLGAGTGRSQSGASSAHDHSSVH
jgi:hypothetical protein